MASSQQPGTIGWLDLTVPDATAVRDFYSAVVGWKTSDVPMGDYADYCVHPADGADPVGGICHARGSNAGLPPVWIPYFTVADLEASVAECQRLGGTVIAGPKSAGGGQYCILRDPAGAVAALYCSPGS